MDVDLAKDQLAAMDAAADAVEAAGLGESGGGDATAAGEK